MLILNISHIIMHFKIFMKGVFQSIGIYKNPVKRKMSKKMYKWKIR